MIRQSTRRMMVISSKIPILATRGRYDFNSYPRSPSILNLPDPQVLVRSYELAWVVLFNNNFESKMSTRRK